MAPSEAQDILNKYLVRLQKNVWFRRVVGGLIVLALAGWCGYSAWELWPRTYTLRITGGDILGNRHKLTTVLRQEAAKRSINLVIEPISGSLAALEALDNGELDLAIIQGGLDVHLPNVRHVTAIMPEVVHLLVRPEIKDIKDLKGKVINMGSKEGGTRIVAQTVLNFSQLEHGVDYAETNYSSEKLTALPLRKMPDAIFILSTLPSFLVEYLVKHYGYQMMELPFPASLSLRFGWVANATILSYTYGVNPPIPAKDIKALGVNMFMGANSKCPPGAVADLLEVLFSVGMETSMRQKLDPKMVTTPSGFPISEGTTAYLKRQDPVFSEKTWKKLQGIFGLVMSLASGFLVITRWLMGAGSTREEADREFKRYLGEVAAMERELSKLEAAGGPDADALGKLAERADALYANGIERYTKMKMGDPNLMNRFLLAMQETRGRIERAREVAVRRATG